MYHLRRLGTLLSLVALTACAGDDPTAARVSADGNAPLHEEVTTTKTVLTPVGGQQTYAVADAVIGLGGGTLKAGYHKLIVPRGAVEQETLFRLEQVAGSYIRVELHAYERDPATGEYSVDVGARGFKKPVQLMLSYENGLGVINPKNLGVAWLVDGTLLGEMVPQPSTVDVTSQWIKATLQHFSGYILTQG